MSRNKNTSVLAKQTDHEYFSTPITPSSGTPSSRVYMTPTSNTSPALLMPVKGLEARRRLNLDSAATVDQDGFKTPIKGTKRKHDFSSPSPKKCKALKYFIISLFNFYCLAFLDLFVLLY